MKEEVNEEKALMASNKGIWLKLKEIFKKVFRQSKLQNNNPNIENKIVNNSEIFKEYIRNIENEETKLLKLQQKYQNNEITEDEMTAEQITMLSQLYDKQIEELRKSNEIRKKRLASI